MAVQAERPQDSELIDEDQYGPQLVNKLEVFSICVRVRVPSKKNNPLGLISLLRGPILRINFDSSGEALKEGVT